MTNYEGESTLHPGRQEEEAILEEISAEKTKEEDDDGIFSGSTSDGDIFSGSTGDWGINEGEER